jgi:class 3 adenylate cyclase
MSTDDVVDISDAPSHSRRRWVWLRVGVPVGGVALVIIAILGIALYSDRVNRVGVLALSDDLLDGLQSRIAQQVASYLDPATRATRLARDMAAQTAVADHPALLQAFAASALRQIPQIDAFYVGDAAGNFMMVRRSAAGGVDTKLIRNAPGAREVEWIHRDAEGRVIGQEQNPTDDYDPRTRTWYQGALNAEDAFWTSVYIFFTDRLPGVTAAIRYRGPDGAERVFGVDITLEALSHFLASLKIGRTGRAVIVDGSGHLTAAPDASHILREQNGQVTAVRLDQLDDRVLTSAYDRFRVEGDGRRVITVDGQRIVSIASRLPAAGRDWTLLIVVPEEDFTGFVATNGHRTLALSLIVVALAALLAGLLVRQGLRTDRTAQLLLERDRAIERQSVAFATLARQAGLFDPSQEGPMQVLTETFADIGAARRASVWRGRGEGMLRCEDAYERDDGSHVIGLELTRAELPQFFAALAAGEEIEIADATNDRRTAELHRVLMHPIGSRAVFVMPIPAMDGVAGAVILEDAAQLSESRDFLRTTANMLATRMRSGALDAPVAREAETTKPVSGPAGERSFAAELARRGLDAAALGADVFPSVAVLVIKFTDPAAMAARCAADASVLADRIAATMQDIADSHDIPYMKLVGQDVMAAAGCIPADTTAILRVADAAVAARDRCLSLFEAADHPPSFRIGIDYGIVMGSQVGRDPSLFNLWGEAVRTAELMASSAAAPGAIQVSEAAHSRLRDRFLFRPRGSFYLPHVGQAQTFVLASRL